MTTPFVVAHAQRAPLTIERIVASPSLTGTAPAAPAWSPDSRHLAFLWSGRGGTVRELWVVERNGSTPRRVTGPTTASAPGAGGVGPYAWSPDGGSLVYLRAGDAWRVPVGGAAPAR